jgi:exonuclease III
LKCAKSRSRNPSIICLQEVREKSLNTFKIELQKVGFEYFYDSVLLAKKNIRTKGNIIASKNPSQHLPDYIRTPHPESILSIQIISSIGKIMIHNTHIPNGSTYGWTKIETFEAIYKKLSTERDNFRILCGDFNSPQAESTNGETITWGQRITAENEVITRRNKHRWHEGELCVIRELEKFNLPDVYRYLYGYQKEDYSFVVVRKGKVVSRRRFDHIFASKELNPQNCEYIHSFREEGLSDHSPLEIIFNP